MLVANANTMWWLTRCLAGLRACVCPAQLRASGAAAEPVEPESEEEAAGAHVRLGARRKARRGEQ